MGYPNPSREAINSTMHSSYSAAYIETLVRSFIQKTLAKTAWNHQAHLLVAIWHNLQYDFPQAVALVKVRIKAFNEAVGTPNTDDSGYHESLTIFWMTLTKNFLLAHPQFELDRAVNQFLRSEEAQTSNVFRYYRETTIFSKAARLNWVNGDLIPITLNSES